ncbi:MAG: hypothetical protein JO151_19785 [Verrucomicrobia bacterium]|jgi:hypothetical protein|nr:hypothetical protein [Verrucomicrobiota bacterium]
MVKPVSFKRLILRAVLPQVNPIASTDPRLFGALGIWDGVRWDGKNASFYALRETDEEKAREKLFES